MEHAYCIGPGMRVTLSYILRDEDGDIVEATEPDEPLVYLHGFGQVLPALERRIEGMYPGSQRSFTLPPEEGYGEHDPDGLFQVHRSEFPVPEEVQLDEEFTLEGPDGEEMTLRVLEFTEDDHVLVDTNHPLAGVVLHFEVTVEGVEPASEEELEAAERALTERGFQGEMGGFGGLIQLGRKPKKSRAT
ncbi:MAG: FKBP-type peptidyl-prolyl cis-trans isomerase [Myxococcales bacterium]|nr:FKBP-type peptidyl-prolyl cis-trans isomerase [Myxococcales bacterium]